MGTPWIFNSLSYVSPAAQIRPSADRLSAHRGRKSLEMPVDIADTLPGREGRL